VTVLVCLAFVAIVVLFAGLPLAHWSHHYWRLR
jgi:hypothetical protein